MTRYTDRLQRLEEARMKQLKSLIDLFVNCLFDAVDEHVADATVRKALRHDLRKHASQALTPTGEN